MIGKILLRRLEHSPAETNPLEFRREVELEYLAAIGKGRHAIAAVACIAGDAIVEVEHEKTRAARDRVSPPYRAASSYHSFEFASGDDSAIGVTPSRVVNIRDLRLVAGTRCSNCDERFDHGRMLGRRACRLQVLTTTIGKEFSRLEKGVAGAVAVAILRSDFAVKGARSESPCFEKSPLMPVQSPAFPNHYKNRIGAAVVAALICLSVGASADTWRASYNVSLIGIEIGKADVVGRISPTQYQVEGRAKIAGLASLLSSARGAASGSGAIDSGRVLPATFATTAANSKMTRTIRMALAGGDVTGLDIAPPIVDKPGRIPLRAQDERDVIDPLGAIIVPLAGRGPLIGPAACNRSVPIFDGYTRFDIRLSYVGERQATAKGYSGPVVVCSARYVPVAGHNPDRPAIKFMVDNREMEVWLAPIESAHVLVPFRASVLTMVGTAVVEASEFSVQGDK
jgi:uncharacterized protein DUF3108